ncbi:hypothetical protein CSKR_104234 [Clonorchis sinensis]|uniref:Uncharacterized protein n=1 Tax=Clonorchis sinensis TaxID=79923 RepID=A0A3R7GKV0_CLOSI|nr:hypothetical protein CSKR_104234 [Clonorchis sinensis]
MIIVLTHFCLPTGRLKEFRLLSSVSYGGKSRSGESDDSPLRLACNGKIPRFTFATDTTTRASARMHRQTHTHQYARLRRRLGRPVDPNSSHVDWFTQARSRSGGMRVSPRSRSSPSFAVTP